MAADAVAEVKKDVTVAPGTTFDKTGSGAFTVLGTLKTEAAVKDGAPAGIFNVNVGSVAVNTVANAGTTTVASGASFSVTGTGSVNSGTISIVGTTGISQGTASTAGSLTVAKGADFVNTGFISGSTKTESNKTTYTAANTGDVIVAGTFTNYGTVDGKTVNGYIGANSLTVEEGGVLNTKITDSYAVAKTTVKGTFNLTELNSSVSGKKTDPKDQLVLAGEMTLDGGLVTLNGQEFTGNVQLGLSNGKPDDVKATVAAATVVVKGARDYKASQITFRPKGQSQGNDSTLTLEEGYEGTYTVGTLDAVGAGSVNVNGGTLNVDTKLTTNANGDNVHVGKDGTLALTKTAIGLTVATSGETETHAVAGTFKGVENAGRVLVTGLDGMTVKAGTLTKIKDAIVKTNTGFIDFGKLAVDAKTVSGYDSTANTLTASGAATLDGMHLDQFKNTTVTDVPAANTLNGSFGAVKLASGTASFTVADAKQVYLNNSGNLVVDKDGMLADVAVGNGSSFVTTGQNAVVGGVTGASGSFVVESGSLEAKGNVNVADLTVTGALTVNEKAAVPASGSTLAKPAQKYTVTATNLTVEQGGVLNVLHDVTLNSGSGALAVDGTMNVKGVLSANNRTINVGSDNSTGVLTVGTLKNATVFADPAWNNGMEAAQVAVKTLDSTAKVEAGRNSIVAVGTTDITKAQVALAQTGLKLGEVTKGSVGVVNAVAYVTAEPTVTAGVTDYNGTTVGGNVLVSGAKQATQSITHGLDVKKGTLAIIDASGFDKSGAIAVFSNSINIDDGATVYLSNLKNGDKLNLTTATRSISDSQTVPYVSVGNANIVFAGDLLMNFEAVKDAAGNKTSVYQMSMVDRAELAKMGAVAGLGAAYGMFAEGVDNNSSSAQFNKWLYTSTTSPVNDGTEEGNFVALQTAAKDVASLGATTGVQTMTMDAVNQMGETVADRVSLLTQRAAGVNVWAAANGGMFEAKSLFDGAGYESDIYSGVLGVDYQFACNAVLGAALTIGTADTDNKNSTVKASTDSDLVGFSVYASKTFADVLGVSADIGYLTASNDVTANGYGQSWKFSQDTDAFTIGLRTEVLAEVGAVKLVPHIGIRYTALSTDGFEAGYKTEIDDQNIFQMPVGVTVSGDFQTGDWTVAPKFDLSFVPTFGDKDADLKLGITGVNATDDLAVRVIDSNPVQATLGVNATNGAWGFGLNYKLGVGSDDRMNNTFNVNVRYAF